MLHSLDEAIDHVKATTGGDIYIIGGAELYNTAFQLPACTSVYWTRVRPVDAQKVVQCDTFVDGDAFQTHFDLDETLQEETIEKEWAFTIAKYKRKS